MNTEKEVIMKRIEKFLIAIAFYLLGLCATFQMSGIRFIEYVSMYLSFFAPIVGTIFLVIGIIDQFLDP